VEEERNSALGESRSDRLDGPGPKSNIEYCGSVSPASASATIGQGPGTSAPASANKVSISYEMIK